MLIPFNKLKLILTSLGINITGILHIGAHDCEELQFYLADGIYPNQIIWIDAMNEKVIQANERGIPNVYNAVISDKEEELTFKITNNGQSSSILDLDTHLTHYPDIIVVEERKVKTVTLKNFFETNNINPTKYNFWNLDIQGAELFALKSAEHNIKYAQAIYVEVNVQHLYKDCPLLEELDHFLNKNGFQRILTELTGAGWGDAFYIRINN
jgi:FkbM family methyltransferase